MLELEVDDIWEVYEDVNGKWRWTRIAATGEIVETSEEGYQSRSECLINAEKYGYWEN